MLQISLGNLNQAVNVGIASGQTSSPAIPTGGMPLVGIKTPATLTGTAISFLMCESLGGTYVPIIKAGSPLSYAVGSSEYVTIDPTDFYGVAFLKIVSNATEAADRNLICAFKGM